MLMPAAASRNMLMLCLGYGLTRLRSDAHGHAHRAGQLGVALAVGCSALSTYTAAFATAYPLTKLDLVGLPNFAVSGAAHCCLAGRAELRWRWRWQWRRRRRRRSAWHLAAIQSVT